MSDKKSGKVTIVFKEELLKAIPKVITKVSLPRFFREIIETVPQFIPQDTQTLVNSHYTDIDEENLVGIVGYGSKFNMDDPLNIIAIVQHEKVMYHYGEPGKSMRLGVQGADIPGKRYAMFMRTLPVDTTLAKQKKDYQKGYKEKSDANQLTPYATKFLEKAIYKVVQGNMKKFFNEDIADFVAKGQNKADEKNPRQKIKGL